MADIADLRRNYTQGGLHEDDAAADPFAQFERWFAEARETNTGEWFEVNAFTLCTVTADGKPSARVMLLKDVSPQGFTFYTNFASRKGEEIDGNPNVAMVFYWPRLERQVRVEGAVTKIDRKTAEAYFLSRPKGNQLGAVVSRQSKVIPNRDVLEQELTQLWQQYADTEVPMPKQWGGYLVQPTSIEFWQGRESRLHDRLEYVKQDSGWKLQRLSP